MYADQRKVKWQGEVVSVQPRCTAWRYLIDNRTHRECGYNVFLKGEARCGDEVILHESGSDKSVFSIVRIRMNEYGAGRDYQVETGISEIRGISAQGKSADIRKKSLQMT